MPGLPNGCAAGPRFAGWEGRRGASPRPYAAGRQQENAQNKNKQHRFHRIKRSGCQAGQGV